MAPGAAGSRGRGAQLLLRALAAPCALAAGRPPPALAWGGAGSWPPLPSPRADAAAAASALGGVAAVFGGKGADGAILGSTALLDTNVRAWRELPAAASDPPARFSAILAAVRDGAGTYEQLVLMAGEGLVAEGRRAFFGDAWALCVHGCSGPEGPAPALAWRALRISGGLRPPGRYGTAGGAYVDASGRGVVLMTHGFDGEQRFDDTWALTLLSRDEAVWNDVSPPEGSRPFGRCLHMGTVVSDASLARMPIFGGCGTGGYGPCPDSSGGWVFERSVHGPPAEPGVWRPVPRGARPRLLGAMAPLPSRDATVPDWRPRVVLYGGTGGVVVGSDPPDHVALLDVSTGQWTALRPSGAGPPEALVKASMVAVAPSGSVPEVLVLGGLAGGQAVAAVHALKEEHGGQGQALAAWGGGADLRAAHGALMLLAWGVLVPIGVTAARFGRTSSWFTFFGVNWFQVHRLCNGLAVLLSTAALVLAILMVATAHFLARPHAQLGLTVALLGVLQPCNAFFRPEPPDVKTPARVRWEMLHKTLGRTACLLGALNPFWGLAHLCAPEGGCPLPLALYSAWIGALALFWAWNTGRRRPGSEPGAEYRGDQPLAKTGLCPCLAKPVVEVGVED